MEKQKQSTSKKLSAAKSKRNAEINSQEIAISEKLKKQQSEKRVSPVNAKKISSAKAEARLKMSKTIVVPTKKIVVEKQKNKPAVVSEKIVDHVAIEEKAAEQRVENFIDFLSKKSVSELCDYAKKHGIIMKEKKSKSTIIKTIVGKS